MAQSQKTYLGNKLIQSPRFGLTGGKLEFPEPPTPPPVTADAFYWDANDYTSGAWVDRVNSIEADPTNSPTTGGASGAKYIQSSDGGTTYPYFLIERDQFTNGLWSAQGIGQAVGSFEFFGRLDLYSDVISPILSSWSDTTSERAWQFNVRNRPDADADKADELQGWLCDTTGDIDGISNWTPAITNLSLDTWYHIVWAFDAPGDDTIEIYINNTSIGTSTLGNATWNDTGAKIGLLCTNHNLDPTRAWKGIAAVYRGYNSKLTSTQVTDLYNHWTGIYT